MNIQEIRSQYPQYKDLSDQQLADALHQKHYADIPKQDFYTKIGLDAPAAPLKIGREGLYDAIKQVSQEYGSLSKAAIGAAGWVHGAQARLKQLVGRDLSPEDLQGIKEYAALKEASGEAVAGDIGMNLLATLNPAMKVQQAGAAVLGRVMPKLAAEVGSTAATAGAATALTEPVLPGESTAWKSGTSAAIAAGADLATRGAARAVQPIIQSEAVKKLTGQGIVPTVGQAAGGLVNKIEQQLESIPVVGWFVSGGRGRAVEEMNEEAIKKALPAGTREEIKAGREGIEKAGELIDATYDRVYGRLTGKYSADGTFQDALKNIPKTEGIDLPESLTKRFNDLIKDRVLNRLESGASGEAVRDINNSLGALARKYRASGDPDQRALGEAFAQAKAEFRASVSRQAGDDFKPALDALDKKYSALLAVEKAADYAGSKGGIFSAEALKRASSKSSREMQEFSENASDVLGRTVPDSGTAGRAALALAPYALSGGAAAGNEYLGGPGWLTAAAVAPLAYSRFGSRYLIGDYPAQAAVAEGLRGISPSIAQIVRAVAAEAQTQQEEEFPPRSGTPKNRIGGGTR